MQSLWWDDGSEEENQVTVISVNIVLNLGKLPSRTVEVVVVLAVAIDPVKLSSRTPSTVNAS